jgi:general L-amino acid transport system permease protein
MEQNTHHISELKPPPSETGVLGWMKKNLFDGFFNSLLTIATLYLLWELVPAFVRWAFIDSVWFADSCSQSSGACWAVITENFRFILFGIYPYDEQWRPLACLLLFFVLLVYSANRRRWKKSLLYCWGIGLLTMGLVMRGGLFGLVPVESSKWGGLPLTLMLSFFGLTAAYPLGVVLALARRSQMAIVRSASVVYIEMIRGVPLISMLFMSSVIFPLFLPRGITINSILRAQAAFILFFAAYIAEVVRAGLQAMPKGQFEAAESIGLNYIQTLRLIILPQALKMVIPPTVNVLITAFKDTSLVVIIALFDVLKTTKTVIANPTWMSFSVEAYIFVALIYFIFSFSMSHYSRRLEKDLSPGE